MVNMAKTLQEINNKMLVSKAVQYHTGRIQEGGDTIRPRHCQDLLREGDSGRGVRQVYPFPELPHYVVDVFCDQITDGGGWLVFQRRLNTTNREDFYRTWIEYKSGFGNLMGEMWLGLDVLNKLSESYLQQLRIDMSNWEDEYRWAKYGVFSVGPPEDNYRLTVDR